MKKRVEISSEWYDSKTPMFTPQSIKKDSEVRGSFRFYYLN